VTAIGLLGAPLLHPNILDSGVFVIVVGHCLSNWKYDSCGRASFIPFVAHKEVIREGNSKPFR